MKGVFIHIPKTAGTTVYRHTGEVAPRVRWKHGTADAIARVIGEDEWQKLFTFAFVRNPWKRFASWYKHGKKYDENISEFKRIIVNGIGLIDNFHSPDMKRKDPATQKSYLTGPSGEVLVDFIGRVEHFDEDFKQVCDELGLGNGWQRENVSAPYDYREMYDEESKAVLAERCKWEIDVFGYSFEEEA